MEEKYYGILMNNVSMDGNISLYKPQCLIEGNIIDENDEFDEYRLFVDDSKSEYVLADDPVSVRSELVVAYPMTSNELIEMFHVDSIEQAKICFTDWAFDNVHFGEINIDEETEDVESISMVSFPNKDFSDMVFHGNLNNNVQIPINESAVILGMSDLENLLKIEDFESLRQTIGSIYHASMQVVNEANGKKSNEELYNLFQDAYDSLVNIDNLEEMKKTLSEISEMYLNYLVTLDSEGYSEESIKEAMAFLYFSADRYEQLSNKNDLESIKVDLKALVKEEQEKMNRILLNDCEEKYELDTVKEQEKSDDYLTDMSVKDVKAYFDQFIIGQEEAKKDVIAAIYMNKLGTDVSNKNNCLLVGPTGSGKTLIAETVANYYDMPIEIIDTTQLTVPGYVGANIEDFLARLLDKANGDLKRAENGIVVFDEIDKKGSSRNDDVSGRGVLNTLLPFISGTTYDVTYNRKTIHFNTSNLTIFATGAFTNANEESTYGANKIGFNRDEKKTDIEYKKLNIDDFVKSADIPAELIGRFSVITQLDGHTIESLRRILTESNKSALLSEKEKFEKINVELRWTDGYLDKVAEKALELKTGARSLKSTVDKSIKEARWEVLSNLDIYSGIILTDKTVEDNHDCLLVDKEGNTHSFKEIIESKEKTNLVLIKK